jgi:hypothetical protein
LRFIGLFIVSILFKASKQNILDQEKNVIFLPSSGCGSRLAGAAISTPNSTSPSSKTKNTNVFVFI